MITRNIPDPIENNLLYVISRGMRGDRWHLNRFTVFKYACPDPEMEKLVDQLTAEFLSSLSDLEKAEWESREPINPVDIPESKRRGFE